MDCRWDSSNIEASILSRDARVDNSRCSEVKNGVLQIRSIEEADSVDNRFGKRVKFSHGCYRTALPGSSEEWCNFTENMRIEVRFKRNAYEGFNDALWFMGNNIFLGLPMVR